MHWGTRRLGVWALALAATVAGFPVLIGDGPRAVAVPQEGVVISSPEEVTYEFGPILGSNPTREVLQYPSLICDTVFIAACDTVPVKIELPDLDADQGYASTTITLEWDDPTGAGVDDLDIYLWDDINGEFIGRSVSTRFPEVVTTEGTEFIAVINHYAGVNSGYRLKFRQNIEVFEKPFELPEPPKPGSIGLPTGSPLIDVGPGAGDIGVLPPVTPDIAGAGAGPALAKIDLVPVPAKTVDIDFEAAQREIEEAQEALASADADPGGEISAGVWFWLVLLPIAAVGSAGAWLVRRRPATLKR